VTRAVAPAARPAAEAAPVEPARVEPAPAAEPEPEAEPAAADDASVGDAPSPAGPLRLEAISAQGGEPVAVVSGQVVRVGDRIGASTVVRIGVTEIELETDGLRRILRF
jgi:uncharacterized membrane protein